MEQTFFNWKHRGYICRDIHNALHLTGNGRVAMGTDGVHPQTFVRLAMNRIECGELYDRRILPLFCR